MKKRDNVVLSGEGTDSSQVRVELSRRNQELAGLLQTIASGEESSLTTLYDLTSRLVYGLALQILRNAASAEEVLLDVYKQVWRQAAKYDERRGTPLAWLTTLARSRAIDRLRSGWQEQLWTKPLETVNQVKGADCPENAAARSEMQRLVRAALERLPPEQQEVIDLAYYGGLSHSEIAAQINQPLGTVKTRARLGMVKLRTILEPVLLGEQ